MRSSRPFTYLGVSYTIFKTCRFKDNVRFYLSSIGLVKMFVRFILKMALVVLSLTSLKMILLNCIVIALILACIKK